MTGTFTHRQVSADVGAVALAATGGSRPAAAQEVKLRLGHPLTSSDKAHTAMAFFAENLKKRSK